MVIGVRISHPRGVTNPSPLLHLIGKGSFVMRAAPSDVLLLEILLIPSRIVVIFNGSPHRSGPNFNAPIFFASLYLSLPHPRIIISQLFRRIKKRKRIRLRGNPIFRCVIFLLRGSQIAREIFARHPRLRIHYFKHANILSTRILLLVMQISIRNLRKIDR